MAMTPRQRARVSRGIQYAVLLGAVAAFAVFADWGLLQEQFFQVDIIAGMLPDVITVALRNTILYTAFGFTFGLALGLVLAQAEKDGTYEKIFRQYFPDAELTMPE